MNVSSFYILIAIIVLSVITGFIFLIKPADQSRKLSPLAGLSFAFVIAGILFGEERWLGYGLMGIGIFLAAIDIIVKVKARN